MRYVQVIAVVFLLAAVAFAQDQPTITWENITAFQSVQKIDYATAPDDVGELVSGWLRISPDGQRIATINRANDVLIWDVMNAEPIHSYRVEGGDGINANMLDIAWSDDGQVVYSLHNDGAAYTVSVYELQTAAQQVAVAPLGNDLPVRVWAGDDADTAWLEVLPQDVSEMPYVVRLSMDTGSVQETVLSAPEADPMAMVRIGRMPAPLAVTSTPEGLVQLWDLEQGERLSAVQLDNIPAFGHMNGPAGRRLLWRDPQSQQLSLLDFDTESNQVVAALDGTYYQGLLLGPDASVVIGVNADLEPRVVAWDVASGERVDLGEYRECGRTPDMIQLSEDGTTLAIGCDTGIDIWRID